MLLLALLRTLWRLSYQELREWLCGWPALACGLRLGIDGRPRVPSKAEQSKRLFQLQKCLADRARHARQRIAAKSPCATMASIVACSNLSRSARGPGMPSG